MKSNTQVQELEAQLALLEDQLTLMRSQLSAMQLTYAPMREQLALYVDTCKHPSCRQLRRERATEASKTRFRAAVLSDRAAAMKQFMDTPGTYDRRALLQALSLDEVVELYRDAKTAEKVAIEHAHSNPKALGLALKPDSDIPRYVTVERAKVVEQVVVGKDREGNDRVEHRTSWAMVGGTEAREIDETAATDLEAVGIDIKLVKYADNRTRYFYNGFYPPANGSVVPVPLAKWQALVKHDLQLASYVNAKKLIVRPMSPEENRAHVAVLESRGEM